MASYDPPIVGKVGVRSGVSKKMAFGICCDTKKEALDKLRKRIGWDSAKWRWKTDSWNKADIKDYEEYKHELKIFKMQQESERKLKRKLVSYIKANITKLKDEYIEKFNKTFMIYMFDDKKGYYNVRSAYHTLNKWLEMPERLKEQSDVAEN